MRFDLLLVVVLLVTAMLDEVPQAFALVFVDDRDSDVGGSFYRRPLVYVDRARVVFRHFLECFLHVQGDGLFLLVEVHVGVGCWVIDLEGVVEVDLVLLVVVAAVGFDLEHDEGGQLVSYFDLERALPCICCLEHPLQI